MTGVSDCAQNDPQHLWIWALTALSGILKGHAAFVARFAISRADRAEQEKARAPCSPGRECSIGRFRRPGGRSLTEEPKVRRLCAGGSRIRTIGPPRKGQHFFETAADLATTNRPGGQSRILTIDKGRFIVRRARLAPAMISTPGHRASRRRQRGACQPGH